MALEQYANGRGAAVPPNVFHSAVRDAASGFDSGPNVSQPERIISSVAGALLTAYGLSSSHRGSLLVAGLGGALLHRGMTGRCYCYRALGINTAEPHPATVIPAQHGVRIEHSINIQQPPAELYGFWRELENLPKVMKHLKSVDVVDRDRSHWVADGPLGKTVEWDAEIFNDVENELIAWRSLPGGDLTTVGSVRFTPLGNDRGTKVTVNMKYDPPAGKVGAWAASMLGASPDSEVQEDLRRFKQMMESGDSPTTEGQSFGAAGSTGGSVGTPSTPIGP
jgi:uncharacterized membrane protein